MRSLLLVVVLAACPAPPPATIPAPRVVVTPPIDGAPAAPTPTGLEPAQPTLRLPKNFVPTGYAAKLAIDPAEATFYGAISITGTVGERSSVIWLHGRHLAVSRAAATRGDPTESPDGIASKLTVTPRGDDLLELRAEPPLASGTWQLELEYKGEVDTLDTTGAFVEAVGADRYVYSQFEAIYARRVFPCVDEPDSKVPWQLTLEVPKGTLAVSNTPVAHETALGGGGRRYEFAPTKPLPAYLVAFGVGPFAVVDAGKTKSGTPVRVITLKGRAADAAYAAKTTAHIVDLLEDWFGSPYPYAKLDLLTVPVTVGFGAMENAGLVTIAERIMLVDPQKPSWDRRHHWVRTASHELAHQWFGDLVTTAWWDDLWLNEGFANWMENKIVARFEPAWHDELAALEVRFAALDADRLVSARKIRQDIASPDDILNAFDGITYNKGASVLTMFEHYVGADVFQRGVRDYLKARAFGNATSADFVAAISAAAGTDLGPAFATFLDQAGAPELSATIACDKGPPRIELAQQRYVPAGSPAAPTTKPWIVPVCVAYDRGGKRAEACTLLDGPTGSVALDGKTCPRWMMANVDGRGYYRTQLTTAQATALRDEAWPQLSWTERRAVFFDVAEAVSHPQRAMPGARAPAGKLALALALAFVPKLLAGGDRFALGDAIGLPLGLDRLVPDEQRAKYEAWLRASFSPGAAKVGILPKDSDDIDAESTRSDLIQAAAWTGRDPELGKQAVELAAKWQDLPPSVRGSILEVAVDASPELFARVLAAVKTEPDRIRRSEMLAALGAVRDPKRVETALELMLDSPLDFRETRSLLSGTSTEATRRVAETFFRDHQAELLKRLPQDEVVSGLVGVTWIFTSACDPVRRDEIVEYVTKTFATLPGGDRTVKQAIEAMDQCIASREVVEPEIRAWLGGAKIAKPAKPKETKKK